MVVSVSSSPISPRTIVSYLLLVLNLFAPLDRASAQERREIKMAYVSPSNSQSISWIAKETGIFAKNGLNVEMIYMSGGRSTQALVAGSIEFSSNAGPPIVQAGLAGTDVTLIISSIGVPIFSVITRPEIQKPEDFRGKVFGASGLNNLSYFIARRVLKKWGLEPDKDVKLIATRERFPALQQNIIQGTLLSPPENFAAQKAGFRSLAETADMGINYSYAGIITTKKLIREQPDVIQRFVRSYVEGLSVYLKDKETTLKVVGKYARITDRKVLEEAYLPFTRHWRKVPLPDRDGIRAILEDLITIEPKARGADPDSFFDASFVRKLVQEGFVDKLYANSGSKK